MAAPQQEIYTIICHVLGEDTPFPIKIANNEMVGTLKKLIKEEAQIGPPAHQLSLYLVEIKYDEKTANVADIAALEMLAKPPPLLTIKKVADVFKGTPKEGMVHIIVQPPTSSDRKRPRDDENAVAPAMLGPLKRRRLELLPHSSTIYKTESDPGNPAAPALLPTYGGFHEITSLYNLIAADKTRYIELLDNSPKYAYMFLRPRRWGKSTFLQTLTDYYDKAKKDSFEDIFGDLYIGKHPTSARNSLLVLRFDFSEVSGTGSLETIQHQFNSVINHELKRFLKQNQAFLGGLHLELVDDSYGTKSLKQVLELVEQMGQRLFVGVDEYDAPANTVIFDEKDERYKVVAEFFKAKFFAIMKQAAFTVVDKYWITGVLPVFRDGISPLNATRVISETPLYNGLCGLTDTEVRDVAKSYLSPSCQSLELEAVVGQLKRWYNGYHFCREHQEPAVDSLYNPELVFNHLRGLATREARLAPLEEINSVHSSSILGAIPDTGEASFLESYLGMISGNVRTTVNHQFGVTEVRERGKDASITWSLLYFLGVLTHAEDAHYLKVPNVTMVNVITRRFSKFLNKTPQLGTLSNDAYKGLMTDDVKALVKLLERFFGGEPARAVKDCSEAALRTALTAFWSNPTGRCLPELSLWVDPRAQHGEGRSGFLDLFLPSSSSAACIELKNIPLEALWRGNGGAELNSDVPLQGLRQELLLETEEELLERKTRYGGVEKLVKDVKQEAFEQITRYLGVMKSGVASANLAGVHDHRVRQSEEECKLVGYVVILLGGTRALGWRVATEQSKFTLQVKDEAAEVDLIS